MKNTDKSTSVNDAIEKAIEVLKVYTNGKETSLTKIAAHEALQALTQAQEKPSVDVRALKRKVHIAHLKEAYGDHPLNQEDIEKGIANQEYAYKCGCEEAVNAAIDYLAEQGDLGAPVVPEEPSKQMLIAGVKAHLQGAADMNDMAYVQNIYKAMINAAKKD